MSFPSYDKAARRVAKGVGYPKSLWRKPHPSSESRTGLYRMNMAHPKRDPFRLIPQWHKGSLLEPPRPLRPFARRPYNSGPYLRPYLWML